MDFDKEGAGLPALTDIASSRLVQLFGIPPEAQQDFK